MKQFSFHWFLPFYNWLWPSSITAFCTIESCNSKIKLCFVRLLQCRPVVRWSAVETWQETRGGSLLEEDVEPQLKILREVRSCHFIPKPPKRNKLVLVVQNVKTFLFKESLMWCSVLQGFVSVSAGTPDWTFAGFHGASWPIQGC